MIVAQIIARLLDEPSLGLALVEGATELAAVKDAPAALPAAYVYLKEEAAGPNERMSGQVLQRVEADVAVLIVCGNLSDTAGGAAALDLGPLKRAIRTRLLGWCPPSADDVLTSVGGEVVRFRSGVVWWEETFAAAYYLESEP